jgi:hypothetical protein
MRDTGVVVALDPNEKGVRRVGDMAKRLGLGISMPGALTSRLGNCDPKSRHSIAF